MRHNILLDTSVTGSPFHTLRAAVWNIRSLGFWWWLRCLAENALAALPQRPGRARRPAYARTSAAGTLKLERHKLS